MEHFTTQKKHCIPQCQATWIIHLNLQFVESCIPRFHKENLYILPRFQLPAQEPDMCTHSRRRWRIQRDFSANWLLTHTNDCFNSCYRCNCPQQTTLHIDNVHDCGNSAELPQSCAKPSIYSVLWNTPKILICSTIYIQVTYKGAC